MFLINRTNSFFPCSLKAVDDGSDGEVHDDHAQQYHVRDEVHVRVPRPAALDPLRLDVSVRLVAVAVVCVRQVVHDVVPGLARDAPEQQHHRLRKTPKVVVDVVRVAVLDIGEQADAEHAVNEYQQKHQQHDVRDLRQNVDKRVDDKAAERLEQPEHSQNPERPDDRRCSRDVDADAHHAHDDADVGADHDHAVEQVPSRVCKVVLAERKYFDDHFEVEHGREKVVDVVQSRAVLVRHP